MMSKEKRRVPKLRFPGFTEDWEQRKLGSYLTQYTEITTENNQYPVLTSSRKGLFFQTDYYDGNQIASKDNTGYNIVPHGYFTYRHMSDDEIFHFNINYLVDKGIVSTLYPVFTTKNLNSDFLQLQLNYGTEFKKYAVLLKQGGSRTYMYFNKLKDLKLTISTSIDEQKVIAVFFILFEKLITLHQRKLEHLHLKKKALLQKLFPKTGERYPELRFPGFTDAWEQRKLLDISTKVTTKNVNVHYTETLTNSAEQGIISQVDFFDKEISNKDNINGYYIVNNNDFIYNPRISTLAPVGPINRNKLNRTGIMSPLYTVFRSSNVDLGFLEWYFQSSHWHRYMKLNGDSGARADRIAIKDSTFFEMPIKIPVNIKEQVLIGETLEKFNQYITLHQRKLEHLQLQKKALLQQMFV